MEEATTPGQALAPALHTPQCGAQALPMTGSRTPSEAPSFVKQG